jgi:hypothetical protein
VSRSIRIAPHTGSPLHTCNAEHAGIAVGRLLAGGIDRMTVEPLAPYLKAATHEKLVKSSCVVCAQPLDLSGIYVV